jgi:hypothetical protein
MIAIGTRQKSRHVWLPTAVEGIPEEAFSGCRVARRTFGSARFQNSA